MRLTILCEGHTEYTILKAFLSPYTTEFESVRVLKPPGVGGGGRLKREYKRIAELELESDDSAIVFCLIDLYQAPFSFPHRVAADPDPTVARYAYIKKYMETQINSAFRARFFAFPVVMEIETWLLADLQALKQYFRGCQISGWSHPESVSHPAEELKNLMKRCRETDYAKVIHGEQLFQLASAERVYDDNCTHFEALINQLLDLQGVASEKSQQQFAIPNAELFYEMQDLERKYNDRWDQCFARNKISASDQVYLEQIEVQMYELNLRISRFHQQSSD